MPFVTADFTTEHPDGAVAIIKRDGMVTLYWYPLVISTDSPVRYWYSGNHNEGPAWHDDGPSGGWFDPSPKRSKPFLGLRWLSR